MVSSTMQYTGVGRSKKAQTPSNPLTSFIQKVSLAWSIFFPDTTPKEASPKEEVKKRLKMVLVADRCGMTPQNLGEMKTSIVRALQDYVDIEQEDAIEVAISTSPELGTVYSVNIPIRRVKPDTRLDALPKGQVADGVTIEWDENDWNADPSARFPMGC